MTINYLLRVGSQMNKKKNYPNHIPISNFVIKGSKVKLSSAASKNASIDWDVDNNATSSLHDNIIQLAKKDSHRTKTSHTIVSGLLRNSRLL